MDAEHTYMLNFAPSQWETALQSNAVSQWLGANLESALYMDAEHKYMSNFWSNKGISNFNILCIILIILSYSDQMYIGEFIGLLQFWDFLCHTNDFVLLVFF